MAALLFIPELTFIAVIALFFIMAPIVLIGMLYDKIMANPTALIVVRTILLVLIVLMTCYVVYIS